MRSFAVIALAGIVFVPAAVATALQADSRPVAFAFQPSPAPMRLAAVQKKTVKAVKVKQSIKLRKTRQQEMRGLNPQPEPPGQLRGPPPSY